MTGIDPRFCVHLFRPHRGKPVPTGMSPAPDQRQHLWEPRVSAIGREAALIFRRRVDSCRQEPSTPKAALEKRPLTDVSHYAPIKQQAHLNPL